MGGCLHLDTLQTGEGGGQLPRGPSHTPGSQLSFSPGYTAIRRLWCPLHLPAPLFLPPLHLPAPLFLPPLLPSPLLPVSPILHLSPSSHQDTHALLPPDLLTQTFLHPSHWISLPLLHKQRGKQTFLCQTQEAGDEGTAGYVGDPGRAGDAGRIGDT